LRPLVDELIKSVLASIGFTEGLYLQIHRSFR
jgi:hypothetical protein